MLTAIEIVQGYIDYTDKQIDRMNVNFARHADYQFKREQSILENKLQAAEEIRVLLEEEK